MVVSTSIPITAPVQRSSGRSLRLSGGQLRAAVRRPHEKGRCGSFTSPFAEGSMLPLKAPLSGWWSVTTKRSDQPKSRLTGPERRRLVREVKDLCAREFERYYGKPWDDVSGGKLSDELNPDVELDKKAGALLADIRKAVRKAMKQMAALDIPANPRLDWGRYIQLPPKAAELHRQIAEIMVTMGVDPSQEARSRREPESLRAVIVTRFQFDLSGCTSPDLQAVDWSNAFTTGPPSSPLRIAPLGSTQQVRVRADRELAVLSLLIGSPPEVMLTAGRKTITPSDVVSAEESAIRKARLRVGCKIGRSQRK